MLFLQAFVINLVLTKFSCLKRNAIECTLVIFLFSCVCATQKAPPHPYLPHPHHCYCKPGF
jgi:hypothetical protein